MLNPARALVAFLAKPHVQTGLALGTAAAIESNQPSLMVRPRTDQALVVAGSIASGYVVGSAYAQVVERLPVRSPIAIDAVAGAAAATFVSTIGPKLESSRPGALTVTAARTRSYAATTALATSLIRQGVRTTEPYGRLARGAAGVAVASALAGGAFLYLKDRLGRYDAGERIPPDGSDVAWTLAVGMGVATAVGGAVMAERKAASASASALGRMVGGPAIAWLPLTHALIGGSAVLAGRYAMGQLLGKIAASNRSTEIRYSESPGTGVVSGGPGSAVRFDELGLQGRRFVSEASPGERIDEVLDETGAMDAIRVYVGVDSADSVEDRVALAIEELQRTGAFDRSLLIVGSPAGTGYFNYIPVEAAEYLSRGDIASVAIQYGSLPSMLSVSKIPLAIEQHGALLRAINRELDQRDPADRPRVVLYGESLGAQASQGAFTGGGTVILDDLGANRALWAGTPYASQWRREIFGGGPGIDASVFARFASIDEYRSTPDEERAAIRYFFLDHHEDPVTRFGLDLAYRRPTWLGSADQRPPNVSRTQRWVPAVTFWQSAIDTKNAATVIPGEFNALGHDYRADLAQFVSVAYGLTDVTDDQMASIEARLRRSEVERAAKIADGKEPVE
ncbi:MAG: alpha/beta-hydrolase family protein [Actinomycetota bacterium]|nr:alpha/beta-hydrolase family protein [Actinomycetota bacterium]